MMRSNSRSTHTLGFPSLVHVGLPELSVQAYSSLYSDDPEELSDSLARIRLLYFPHYLAPQPSIAHLTRVVELSSSDDPSYRNVSLQATTFLCLLFVEFPNQRPFLFETNFFMRIPNFLDEGDLFLYLTDLLKSSPIITRALDEAGFVPRLLASIASTANLIQFRCFLDAYAHLVSTGIASAVDVFESVVESLAPVGLNAEADRQPLVLDFLTHVIAKAGPLLIRTGFLRELVQNCCAFKESECSRAIRLIRSASKSGLGAALVDYEVITLVHHIFDPTSSLANTNCSCLAILAGIVSSSNANARLVVRSFGVSVFLVLFGDGSSDEKFAMADLVVRMIEYVSDREIAQYCVDGEFVIQLAEMIRCEFRPGTRSIFGALVTLKGELDRGDLYKALADQVETVFESEDFVSAIIGVIAGDDFGLEIREMATALLPRLSQ
jgi:hypothetical protein